MKPPLPTPMPPGPSRMTAQEEMRRRAILLRKEADGLDALAHHLSLYEPSPEAEEALWSFVVRLPR